MAKFIIKAILVFAFCFLEGQTIIVTGGAGFIGSNLCKRLVKEKKFVICIDDLSSGSKRNIEELESSNYFQFIKHDVSKPFKVEGDIDEIYHLACPASPKFYQKDPIQTLKTNFFGTLHLLEIAKEKNAKFLFTSTSEIYGNPVEHPQKESYFGNVNCYGPRACYDEGKRVSESLVYEYRKNYNLDTKIVRIFNTYGPYMSANDGRVVSSFIKNALENKQLIINGDGLQTRSFCYIDDLLDGLLLMMDSSSSGPINLGNPAEISILELAHLVVDKTNSSSGFTFSRMPQDDPLKRRPDITKAYQELKWEPKIDLDTGLQKTIAYYKSHR